MKQTAVEWLKDTLYPYFDKEDREYTNILFEQAKEMEKRQIIQAYETAMETDIYNEPLKIGKDYFEKVFVISHTSVVSSWGDHVVKIKKENNLSKVL